MWQCWNGGTKGNRGSKSLWPWFLDKTWRHCCHSDGLCHHGNPLGLWGIRCWVMWQCWNGGTKGNRGSKSLGHGFWTKHDVIVAIATACATMATHWVCGEFDAESCDSVETVAQRGIGGSKSLGHGFLDKTWRHCCHSDGLCHHGYPLGLWGIRCWVMWQCWNGGTKGNRGSKSLGHGFWTKHDVIVAIATACATMATHWVCGEFDAESCDSVETVAQREIGGQNCLAMVFGQNMTSLLP